MSLLSGLEGYIVGAVGVIIAIVAALFGARRSGKKAERLKQTEQKLKTSRKANEIQKDQLDAGANRPRDREQLRDRMHNGKF